MKYITYLIMNNGEDKLHEAKAGMMLQARYLEFVFPGETEEDVMKIHQ